MANASDSSIYPSRQAMPFLLGNVWSVHIRSFSGPQFPAFGLNTERYGVSFHIQSKRRKLRTLFTRWHWFPCEIIQNFLVNSVSLFISSYLSCCMLQKLSNIWGEVFKNGPSKIYGRHPLKNLKWYGLANDMVSL